MWKLCIKCGKIIPASMGSRCADHPKRWRSGSTPEWRKTRGRILARDGYRCTVHVRLGERCAGTTLLEVHHVDGGEKDVLLVPDSELVTVCRQHNPRDHGGSAGSLTTPLTPPASVLSPRFKARLKPA
jgi:hypothetical protein